MKDDFMDLVEKRWSPRAFSHEELEKKTIMEIFDAGRKVASSYNEQPWSFMIAKKGDKAFERMFDCLGEFNQSWAGEAPYLGVVMAKKNFDKIGEENPHCAYDCGAFMAVASLKAFELDVFIHQMAGFSPKKVYQNFMVPDGYQAITMFVLGKHGEKEDLPEDLQKKESSHSSRKEVKDFLYNGEWGNSF